MSNTSQSPQIVKNPNEINVVYPEIHKAKADDDQFQAVNLFIKIPKKQNSQQEYSSKITMRMHATAPPKHTAQNVKNQYFVKATRELCMKHGRFEQISLGSFSLCDRVVPTQRLWITSTNCVLLIRQHVKQVCLWPGCRYWCLTVCLYTPHRLNHRLCAVPVCVHRSNCARVREGAGPMPSTLQLTQPIAVHSSCHWPNDADK